jgi:hypothetical protein
MLFLLTSGSTIITPDVAVDLKEELGGQEADTEAQEVEEAPTILKLQISRQLLRPMIRIRGLHCHQQRRLETAHQRYRSIRQQ